MRRFSAKIYKLGINPVVDPPEEVLQVIFKNAGRSKGPVPVRGRINGAEFIQTLVKYAGAWRLYINGPMLSGSDLAVGDVAEIEIEYDPRPREVPMPQALAAALRKSKTARSAFDRLSPSRKKEIFKYLASLKTAGAVDRNIERVLSHLVGKETDGQYALMRRKKAS